VRHIFNHLLLIFRFYGMRFRCFSGVFAGTSKLIVPFGNSGPLTG